MIRFVASPGGAVVPDLQRRLPGRGAWITARRSLVEQAIGRALFARSLKANVKAPAGLLALIDRLLEADLICVGEQHDSEPCHRVQLQIVKALHAQEKAGNPPQQLADTTAENTLATAPRERLHPGVARYFREAGLK